MNRALQQAHEDLEDMLQAVSSSFTTVREMLRRSTNPRRNDLTRRINEVNQEFIRLRANGMRHSFEQNLARQEADRRRRRERTDSGSSTDSNNSDYDLDFISPIDLCQYPSPAAIGRGPAPKTGSEASTSSSASEQHENPTAETSTEHSVSPCSSSHSSSSPQPDEKPQSVLKRKMPFSNEEAPASKRSMATSTDDAFFQQ